MCVHDPAPKTLAADQLETLRVLALAAQAPILGNGLGNFEYLFPIFREKSARKNFALHPESDWLWAASELGWPSTILILQNVPPTVPECLATALSRAAHIIPTRQKEAEHW